MMGRTLFLLVLLACAFGSFPQKVQTVVPSRAVIAGAAFQVQYVVTGAADVHLLSDPSFDHFKLVSGPNYYRGNIVMGGSVQHVENITYTLVPLSEGRFRIPGIVITTSTATHLRSQEDSVTVIPPSAPSAANKQAFAHVSFFAPPTRDGMDQLIKNNLFLKATTDRQMVYMGEPVVASFTLYSRLPSFSEVIKTPGFYGFSVLDMLNISEPKMGVETYQGAVFNTSVLRKVQLYPSSTGKLTIDEMHVANNIQLEDSVSHMVRETNYELVSKPILITVKPLPEGRPFSFNGAVGQFRIDGSVSKNALSVNEMGKFILKIAGSGNFLQFGAPEIHWPSNILPQDPVISETFKKDTAPLQGQRAFEYAFTADSSGEMVLPPVEFSYFNPLTARFVTLMTDSIPLHIQNSSLRHSNLPAWMSKVRRHKGSVFLWILVAAVVAIIITWYVKRKPPTNPQTVKEALYIDQLREVDPSSLSDRQFYTEILAVLNEAIHSRDNVLNSYQQQEWQSIQDECHLRIYSGLSQEGKKAEMKKRAEKWLNSL